MLVAAALFLLAPPGHAETFEQALAQTYATSPQLLSARQRLREVDETVPQALSGWRPRVTIQGSLGGALDQDNLDKLHNPERRSPQDERLQVDQPVWTGGRTPARLAQAEAQVRQQRASLRATEAQVLLAAGIAYIDVARDQRIVALNQENVHVLERSLRATRQQWQNGAVTLADVAQTEVRLAQAASALATARGQQAVSAASYVQQIGGPPGTLKLPELRQTLPQDQAQASLQAAAGNEEVKASREAVAAAQRAVDLARANLRPQVALQAYARRARETDVQMLQQRDNVAEGAVTLTIPLYQGGEEYSRIRQAREAAVRAQTEVETARRQAERLAVSALALQQATQIRIAAQQSAVASNRVALEGIRREQSVGARTVLDVLNQQYELLASEVGVVSAQRDEAAAQLQLLASLGRLTADDMHLNVVRYDPTAHYDQVRDKWFGEHPPP